MLYSMLLLCFEVVRQMLMLPLNQSMLHMLQENHTDLQPFQGMARTTGQGATG